jgi:hypothetical protein
MQTYRVVFRSNVRFRTTMGGSNLQMVDSVALRLEAWLRQRLSSDHGIVLAVGALIGASFASVAHVSSSRRARAAAVATSTEKAAAADEAAARDREANERNREADERNREADERNREADERRDRDVAALRASVEGFEDGLAALRRQVDTLSHTFFDDVLKLQNSLHHAVEMCGATSEHLSCVEARTEARLVPLEEPRPGDDHPERMDEVENLSMLAFRRLSSLEERLDLSPASPVRAGSERSVETLSSSPSASDGRAPARAVSRPKVSPPRKRPSAIGSPPKRRPSAVDILRAAEPRRRASTTLAPSAALRRLG